MPIEPLTFQMEQGDRVRPKTTRPVIYGREAVISSGHWLTSLAAARMLMSGGNAFDAAVAATFAAAVVEPVSSFSLGSECVAMFHIAQSKKTYALCGQGGAPIAANIDVFRERGLDVIPTGPGFDAPLAFTTPGMFGAVLHLLTHHGSKSLGDVLAPAIDYAENGIVNYEYMLARLDQDAFDQFQRFPPGGSDVFFESGRKPEPGSLLRQPALARVLKQLQGEANAHENRLEGISAARRCYYNGDIAERIASASQRVGGLLAKADLEHFNETIAEPTSVAFMGYEVCCQSFWSQAPVLLQVLNILEAFDLKAMGFNTPTYIHAVTEAMKLVLADREAYYADPDFSDVPEAWLLSKDYALQRAKLIDPGKAAPGLPEPGRRDTSGAQPRDLPPPSEYASQTVRPEETGTTHICVADGEGNVIGITPSGGAFIKSVFFDELGFTISTRAEMLNLDPAHPNCLMPGKRPRTTLCSYMVTEKGTPILSIGCPGGDAQVQANLQLLLNVVLWGMDPQAAVEAPRFATMSVPNSFYPHSYLEGELAVEEGIAAETLDALRAMGHTPVLVATCGMGATVTRLDPVTRVKATSSDPRRACQALGW